MQQQQRHGEYCRPSHDRHRALGALRQATGTQLSGPGDRAHNLRKNTWPWRTTTAIASPTMDDPQMGPKTRESQAPERLSPSTKYWLWTSMLLEIGLEPIWPKRGSYHPRSRSGRPSTKIVLSMDQIVWPGSATTRSTRSPPPPTTVQGRNCGGRKTTIWPLWMGPSRRPALATRIRSPAWRVGDISAPGTEKGWTTKAGRSHAASAATARRTATLARSGPWRRGRRRRSGRIGAAET